MKPAIWAIFFLSLCGCSENEHPVTPPVDAGDFSIAAPFDTIRSYAGGGGLFILSMTPKAGFSGNATLRIEADPVLGASLLKNKLTAFDTTAELLLRPSSELPDGNHTIKVIAAHAGVEKQLLLCVEAMTWSGPDSSVVMERLDAFRAWSVARDPSLAAAFVAPEFIYNTYPEILIVEHNTILTPSWEIRLCKHVMVPPCDWMKIRFRKRGSVAPLFAALRESDGTIREIPVEEYPTLCGY